MDGKLSSNLIVERKSDIFKLFYPQVGTEPELTQVPKQSNEIRQQRVESYLRKMPQNQRLYDRLLNSGYSNMLWKDGIQITVQTNGSLNIEENLRQTLLASFNEYVDLLKQLGIPVIKLEGKDVKIHEVFSDDLTITDLKGRRAVVIKVEVFSINEKFCNVSSKFNIIDD